eukprot:SAG11_NODE_38209_length_253_cov_0.818182_1_plen_31_part_01
MISTLWKIEVLIIFCRLSRFDTLAPPLSPDS